MALYLATLLKITLINSLRFFVFISPIYLWLSYSESMQKHRIPNKFERPKRIWKEVALSLQTFAMFGLATVGLSVFKNELNYSMTYTNIDDYGLVYTILTAPLIAILMDTWFYWTHRLLHRKKFFNRCHKVHHEFKNPTVWSGYSLHWLEGLILTTGLFLILLIIPHHTVPVIVYVMLSIVYTSWLHSGYELSPRSWFDNPYLRWINTSLHHNLHHQSFGQNYSLYFTFWDKFMGTERLRMEEYYPDKV